MRPGPGRRAARSQRGETLIELLVAVAIMGIAFVVIVGGIATAILGTDIQRQQTGATVALRTAAEHIAYDACPATAASYRAQLAAVAVDGYAVTIQDDGIGYWNPGTRTFEATEPSCADTGLHLVELSAEPTGGRRTSPETLQVVKRRP